MKNINERSFPHLAEYYICTGCMACVDVCSKNAISVIVNAEGHYSIKLNREECVGCKKCEIICKESRTSYGVNDISKSKVFAGWAINENYRSNGTSGGVFAAFADAIIQSKGVVVGASFDGRYAYHKVIKKKEEIIELQGSKYVQSNLQGVYREIAYHLSKGKVLFTGTGCQCAAVIEYFKDSEYFQNLYTIDLVCGGVPSQLLINKYYENTAMTEYKIISFRKKTQYQLGLSNNNQVIYDSKALPITGFAHEMTNRFSCYDCQFSYAHRKTDITIGDLWGDKKYEGELCKGASLLLVHDKKGEELFALSSISSYLIDWEPILRGNRRIVNGKGYIFSPRKHLEKNFSRYKYDDLLKIYGMQYKKWSVIGFLRKCYIHFQYMRIKIDANKEIDRIIKKEKVHDEQLQ